MDVTVYLSILLLGICIGFFGLCGLVMLAIKLDERREAKEARKLKAHICPNCNS